MLYKFKQTMRAVLLLKVEQLLYVYYSAGSGQSAIIGLVEIRLCHTLIKALSTL